MPQSSGSWYHTTLASPTTTTLSIAGAGNPVTFATLYAMPIIVPERVTVSEIGLEITATSTASTLYVGVYSDNNTYPGTLIASSGSIDTTTTGFKSSVVSATLQSGIYWLGLRHESVGATGVRATTPILGLLGMSYPANASSSGCYYMTYTELAENIPNPFPAGASLVSGSCPRVMIKL